MSSEDIIVKEILKLTAKEKRKREDRMRCVLCGKPKNLWKSKKRRTFCSEKCYNLYYRYNFKESFLCKNCNHRYYEYRNASFYRTTEDIGRFCSVKCYLKYAKKHNLTASNFKLSQHLGITKQDPLSRLMS